MVAVCLTLPLFGNAGELTLVMYADLVSYNRNHSAYHKIWFRPKILHDVENIDLSTTMLGTKVDIPFYVSSQSGAHKVVFLAKA